MIKHSPHSFLFYHPGALGDNVLTWPIVAAMRLSYPDYHFIGLGKPEIVKLAQHLGLLDSTIDQESPELLSFWSGKSIPKILSTVGGAIIWLNDPDPSISLLRTICSLPVVQISRKSNQTRPMTQFYWQQVSKYYNIRQPHQITYDRPNPNILQRYILIHPGSGSSEKNYPISYYVQIAREISKHTKHEIAFVLGPAEYARRLEIELRDFLTFKPLNLSGLLTLLQQTILLIGNDSGVSHLAGFTGVPTLALYKQTNSNIWGIKGKLTITIDIPHLEDSFNEVIYQVKYFFKYGNFKEIDAKK
ncbi:MAG: hypothetical protein JSW33_10665 [bacterium]|nr:MAG: hypothetical protein JSW33_10665 [bacterium]